MTEVGWRTLMLATQAGNVAAYRQLLTEVGPWLKRYYRNRLPTSMADDAVQDALMAMHQKRHTYDPAQPFIPWLAAIARHKWIDRLRAMKTRATEELPNDLAVLDHGEAVTSARSIELLLAKLKPAQAEAIRLVKLEGLSIEEASARTRQTQSLVKINIYRGLGRLSAMVRSSTDEF